MRPADSTDELINAVDSKITAVRTSNLDLSMNELADMYEAGELVIDPDFQRMFRWTDGAQSRFIESLILELPVPPIFLIEREDRVYELIDGLQRISSYLHFRGVLKIDGELLDPLVLQDCDIVPELNGLIFRNLPRALDIKLKRSYIRAEILRKESDPRLRYYMFKRLNTGGEILSEQEVRNATIRLLSSDFNNFVIELSGNSEFKHSINIISDAQRKRKFDQELVLRFFSYKNNFENYSHDVSDFMTDYMESVSDPELGQRFDYQSERSVFEKTFSILRKIADELQIESKIFGTIGPSGEPRGQFSVYHYEGITLGLQPVLGLIDPDDDQQIQRLAKAVKSGKADPLFLDNTGAGKNYSAPMRARVSYFEQKFRSAIEHA
ncbi:DUF262 domain-containing protein [[Mycobacterium] zoologicum]|uniref:DUF262 domain-containing protein n=1 Tax=[Mycobacterium] zoologicum TaxID=2872311 RepID=UPI001CDAAED3|nr:DUF262 domain-containing protein [Mycolicibacter sp. MYC101]